MSTMHVCATDVNKLLKRFVSGLSFEGGELAYKDATVKVSASKLELQAVVCIEAGGLRIQAQRLALSPSGVDVDFELG